MGKSKPNKPGRTAAIKTGFPKRGLARQAQSQESKFKTTVSMKPGYMAEKIERSPQRAKLLKQRFGKNLGESLERSPNRFNLMRESLTSGAGAKRPPSPSPEIRTKKRR